MAKSREQLTGTESGIRFRSEVLKPSLLPHLVVVLDSSQLEEAGADLTPAMLAILEVSAKFSTKYVTLQVPKPVNPAFYDSLVQLTKNITPHLQERGARFVNLSPINEDAPELQAALQETEEQTENNTGLTLAFGIGYDERAEVLQSARRIVAAGKKPEEIKIVTVTGNLKHPEIPDADMVLLTSEKEANIFRLPGLTWRGTYAEFVPTPLPFHSLTAEALTELIENQFLKRERRFGALPQAPNPK